MVSPLLCTKRKKKNIFNNTYSSFYFIENSRLRKEVEVYRFEECHDKIELKICLAKFFVTINKDHTYKCQVCEKIILCKTYFFITL